MAAPKGNKFAGSRKGIPNKLTRTVKETVLAVFNDLQSDPAANLLTWAKKNPKDFYIIAAKLIPTEIAGSIEVDQKPFVDSPPGQNG